MNDGDFSTLRENEQDFTGLPAGTRKLGPYQLLNELGRGAMGTVYEAEHTNLKRRVAFKVLPPELAESPDRFARFQREMEAIGRLEHPNIVLATDAGQIDGVYFIAMQLIRGTDLSKVLSERGKLNYLEACEVIRQVAMGLTEINAHGMIHRDIKPSNLLLATNGEIKILDLGIAALRQNVGDNESLTRTGGFLGTPDYVAPEQIFNERPIDIRADIYSLGCTFYHLLCGQAPFSGPEYSSYPAKLLGHAEREPLPLDPSLTDIPEEVRLLVYRMMAKDPSSRFADPHEVAIALEPYCDSKLLDQVASASGSDIKARAKVPSASGIGPTPHADTAAEKRRARLIATSAIGLIIIAAGAYLGISALRPSHSVEASQEEPQRKLLAQDQQQQADAARAETATDTETIRDLTKENAQVTKDIAESVDEVVQNTGVMLEESAELNESVKKIAESNSEVAANTKSIAMTLEQMQTEFREVSRRVHAEPTTPTEWYANALQHAKSGNAIEARRAYLEFFRFDVDAVDPFASFAALLRLQEGMAGARETFSSLPGEPTLPSRRLAEISLQPAEARRELLSALIDDEPKFGPAYFALSETYSGEFGVELSLLQRLAKKEAVQSFLSAHENGQVIKYYLDQTKAAADLEQAQSVLQNFVDVTEEAISNPLELDFIYGTDFFQILINLHEGAQEVSYRFGKTGSFTTFPPPATPPVASISGPRQLSYAERLEQVPLSSPKSTFEVQYLDRNGVRRGPFEFEFDPEKLKKEFAMSSLGRKDGSGKNLYGERAHDDWVEIESAWRKSEPDEIWFTGLLLLGWRAVESMRYGVNVETPDQEFPVPRADYGADTKSQFYVSAKERVKFVVLQVKFTDGTQSPIYRYEKQDD